MLTDFLIDDGEHDGRYAQQARTRRCSGLRMLEKLRHELAQHRANGAEFDTVWDTIVARAMRGVSYHGEQRREWKHVLSETRHAWQDAYQCQRDETVERVAQLEELVA